ncbi:MAG: hypothetical protein ABI954_11570 [Pyrinomonadaceae bacterium]
MIHFLFLLIFAGLTAIAFSIFALGDTRERLRYGLKVFAEFVGIGIVLAWICYFLPG